LKKPPGDSRGLKPGQSCYWNTNRSSLLLSHRHSDWAWRYSWQEQRSSGLGSGRYRSSLQAQNIEQIVAWLLHQNMVGDFISTIGDMPTMI